MKITEENVVNQLRKKGRKSIIFYYRAVQRTNKKYYSEAFSFVSRCARGMYGWMMCYWQFEIILKSMMKRKIC